MKWYSAALMVALALGALSGEARSDQVPYDITFGRQVSSVSTADGHGLSLVRGQDPMAVALDNCVGCAAEGCGGVDSYCGPRWFAYGELLYIRPTNEKVAYAVPINGPISPPGLTPVQVGLEATVDCHHDFGFRVGAGVFLNDCSSLGIAYTHYETDISDAIVGAPPYVLRSLVDHPGYWAAPTDFLEATARLDIDLQMVDLDYRHPLACWDCCLVNYLVGVRYAHLEQTFTSVFTGTTTIETVDAAVGFDGGGIRVGIEGERQVGCLGLMLYGRGVASFVGGNFWGRYQQDVTGPGLVVDTGWNEDRIASILDLEVGFGWTSPCGMFRTSAGYMFSGWYDVLIMDEFIDSVRMNESVDAGDTLGFDGLVARGEIRF
jgi:hypothetical protein